jgi:hypothetical protein
MAAIRRYIFKILRRRLSAKVSTIELDFTLNIENINLKKIHVSDMIRVYNLLRFC